MDSLASTPQEAPEPIPGHPLGVAGRAIIQRSDGCVLLLLRSAAAANDASMWELPGGKMVFGEALVETVTREVQEETGLFVLPKHVSHVGHRIVAPYWVTIVTYNCDAPDEPILLSDEHSTYEWVSIRGPLDRPMTPDTLDALRSVTVPRAHSNDVE